MGQYAGFGTAPRDERALPGAARGRGHRLLRRPGPADPDGPRLRRPAGRGGRARSGVAIDSLADIEILMEGIPLERISQVRTTANSIGYIWAALFVALAEQRGLDPNAFGMFIQNDVLKEYIARGTQIFPPEPSLRLVRRLHRVLRASTSRAGSRSPSAATTSASRARPPLRRSPSPSPTPSPTSTSVCSRRLRRPGRADAVHLPCRHDRPAAGGREVPRGPSRVGAA